MTMATRTYGFALLIGVALLSKAVGAERDYHPGVIGTDDRVRVLGKPGPWESVGQINGASYRNITRCSGTLVAKNIAITAAHCLVDYRRIPVPTHQIHFLAGVPGKIEKQHSIAKCVHFHPGYALGDADNPGVAPSATGPVSDLAHDVAAVVLAQDIPLEPAPLAHNLEARGDLDLVHAAFPLDHRYALTAHFNCPLKKVEDGPLWRTECDTHPASSGGPVFVDVGGKLELGAVMVGAIPHQASFAVPVSDWADLVRDASCPAQ